ncbi:MAG: MucB/RseB C-terminal domain-containing protein [Pseudomonadales bacterium]|nr:MucB/RseB C-terminal domain-containing protein [Pseudomonadales bacterium]NRA16306.1 MucB/RseB C-terminal domain-containing protein [Oceanospirillaceae bacterium]
MYQKSLEPLSAMMDGEIEEFELRRVIERTANDEELKAKWLRYHLAQDVIKGRSVNLSAKIDLVSRVSSALEAEPSYDATTIAEAEASAKSELESGKTLWWKPMASMAVAASVTAAVLLGSQQFSAVDVSPSATVELASLAGGNSGFPQGQYGSNLSTVSVSAQAVAPDVVRTAYGMGQYIQQHRDMTYAKTASWQVNWLPQGFTKIEHRVTAAAEVLLFSNGESNVSINIEPLGSQVASQGMINSDELLAFGVRAENSFITVVGPVSQDVAAKIAASVEAATE